MKKASTIIGVSILFIISSLAAVYLLLGKYYSEGFACSTWVNGVYCTGKSVEEVNKELVAKSVYPGISLNSPDGSKLFIGAYDVDLKLDYTNVLEDILSKQNPYYWGTNFFNNLNVTYEPEVSFDENKFSSLVLAWDIFKNQDELKVSIESTDDGYILINGLTNIPNKEHIIEVSKNAMYNLEIAVDLTDYDNTFTDIPLSAEDKETVALYEKMEPLLDCGISFEILNEIVPVSRADAGSFILTADNLEDARNEKVIKNNNYSGKFIIAGNEKELPKDEELSNLNGFIVDANGNLIISEKKIYDFTQSIAERYNTKWLMDEYREGESNEIIISDNKKGNGQLFDVSDAYAFLKAAYLEETYNARQTLSLGLVSGAKTYDAQTDIGKTYIEVNMKEQMLYYYVDGKLNMDMPIVTGNINRSRGTPTGIFNVYNKRYHTYLRGADYVSYVNYWLGVNKGVGIHDANWRSEFGSEIYKRDGSHGCINCPEEKVSKLWEVVDVGTPVVMYY